VAGERYSERVEDISLGKIEPGKSPSNIQRLAEVGEFRGFRTADNENTKPTRSTSRLRCSACGASSPNTSGRDLLNLSKLADRSSKSLTRIQGRRGCINARTQKSKGKGERDGFVSTMGRESSKIHDVNRIHIRVVRKDVGRSVRVEVLIEAVTAEWTVPAVRW
jgi:hypothetical protein